MATVLSEMGTDVLPDVGCAMIGLAEVEADHLAATWPSELAARNYQYRTY